MWPGEFNSRLHVPAAVGAVGQLSAPLPPGGAIVLSPPFRNTPSVGPLSNASSVFVSWLMSAGSTKTAPPAGVSQSDRYVLCRLCPSLPPLGEGALTDKILATQQPSRGTYGAAAGGARGAVWRPCLQLAVHSYSPGTPLPLPGSHPAHGLRRGRQTPDSRAQSQPVCCGACALTRHRAHRTACCCEARRPH